MGIKWHGENLIAGYSNSSLPISTRFQA